MLDYDHKLYITRPIRKSNFRVVCMIWQPTHDNYLFKDFRSRPYYIDEIIYLQTTNNIIIRFNYKNSEFKIVATNCTFCTNKNKTKKSQQIFKLKFRSANQYFWYEAHH
jgi:hypothetical protein